MMDTSGVRVSKALEETREMCVFNWLGSRVTLVVANGKLNENLMHTNLLEPLSRMPKS